MPEDLIRYDILAQDALRGVLRKVLSEIAKTGLPGEHHFYITFATRDPGVRISSRLLKQYPEDMTIVLQHQYWDLTVTEQALEVGLSFNGVPERLLVPFAAIKAFVDPSVKFQLQFEPSPETTDDKTDDDESAAEGAVLQGPGSAQPQESPQATSDDADADAGEMAEKDAVEPEVGEPAVTETKKEDAAPQAEVVSLDAFRKKS